MTPDSLKFFFPNFELVSCCMSSSTCCLLTCIHISQEASKMILYSHLFKNFIKFVVIHTVKGFSIVNETQIEVFWNSLTFSIIQCVTRSVVSYSATRWTVVCQAPVSMEFSRQEYWSGLPFPSISIGLWCEQEINLYFIKLLAESEVTQSCLTLCDPMDYSLLGSSIHGIF